MSRVVADITTLIRNHGIGCEVHFDFSNLGFIRPAGIVFLTNMIHWLEAEGCRVSLNKPQVRTQACAYLDDSKFFEEHLGVPIWEDSRVRSTTLPVQLIRHERIHQWLRGDLIPWLAGSLNVSSAALSDLQVCISELFNNIKEHTRHDIGSIFVQHYPNEKRVIIVLADFGVGIPETVRRVEPSLEDAEAIIKATQEGFSSHSIATNQGYGLDILLKTVVERNQGWVTIYSRQGIVRFAMNGTKMEHSSKSGVGFCPGTTVEINLRTDTIVDTQEDEEDFEW